jgi:glutaminyl-peptide cyclotransferase
VAVRGLLSVLGTAVFLAVLGAGAAPAEPAAPQPLRVEVLRSFPHDTEAFTQGLELDGGRLLESTGLYEQSSLREVAPSTGRVVRRRELQDDQFGEGLTVMGNRIVQLTWQENVALVYERNTFRQVRTFTYAGEGWGICFDGRNLVTSDGSAVLTIRDPLTYRAVRRVTVTLGGSERVRAGLKRGPVELLNELECVGGSVYANVWGEDLIVRIDLRTGRVSAVVDASGLLSPEEAGRADVLNGIAFDEVRGVFLVTGKLWPRLFEVQFVTR